MTSEAVARGETNRRQMSITMDDDRINIICENGLKSPMEKTTLYNLIWKDQSEVHCDDTKFESRPLSVKQNRGESENNLGINLDAQ